MTISLYEKLYRYIPKHNNLYGVFQSHINNIQSFVEISGSSTNPSYDDSSSILTNDNSHWESQDRSNSYLLITLSHHTLRLSHFTLHSCNINNCVYHFNVYGSNDLEHYENVCEINVEKDYFKNNPNNVSCISQAAYKRYQFKATFKNKDNKNIFPIYYLELFGDLYNIKPNIIMLTKAQYPHLILLFISTVIL